MKEGKFVSDEIVNKLIKEIIFDPTKKNKLIFDGYPRTLSQAKNLDLLLRNSDQKINLIFLAGRTNESLFKIEARSILKPLKDSFIPK